MDQTAYVIRPRCSRCGGVVLKGDDVPGLSEARTPEGLRIYAIGDVHGCLDLLEEAHGAIAADLAARPAADWRIVHVGDYVDRGPQSRGVVEYLMGRCAAEPRNICLKGNHDQMFAECLSGQVRWLATWLQHGGVETLASYGLDRVGFERRLLGGDRFDDAVPPEHLAFLFRLGHHLRFGDFFFAHAGVNPDRALDDQDPHDLMWIRKPFLEDRRDHGAVIVHGHTPVRHVDVRDNRIGIDTAAVFQGTLSCIVLEGQSKERLTGDGRAPLV